MIGQSGSQTISASEQRARLHDVVPEVGRVIVMCGHRPPGVVVHGINSYASGWHALEVQAEQHRDEALQFADRFELVHLGPILCKRFLRRLKACGGDASQPARRCEVPA